MPIVLIILGGITISTCFILLFYIFFKEDKTPDVKYTEKETKTMCVDSLKAFCENVYFGEPNWEADFEKWFNNHKKK